MPGLDRTGPRGLGPMTGGGFGLCTGFLPMPYSPYDYRQPMMAPFLNKHPNYVQNPYEFQNQPSIPTQQPYYTTPMQQPYYSGFPFGWGMGRGLSLGWGRGFGMGMAYRRGMGWGGRGAYGFW